MSITFSRCENNVSNRVASKTLIRLPVFIKRRVVLVSVDVQYRRSVFAVGVATKIVAKRRLLYLRYNFILVCLVKFYASLIM
jgi:hypothetical protein